MMRLLFHFLRFVAEYAWLIWPGALLGDLLLSKCAAPGGRMHRARWAVRPLHALALVAFVMCGGVEFFWLKVMHFHHHGGWEILVVGPLVLYVAIRLAQRLDPPPSPSARPGFHSVVALGLPAVSAVLLLVAGFSAVAGPLPVIAEREPTLIFLVPLLSLIAAGSLSCGAVGWGHVVVITLLAGGFFVLTVVCLVAADFRFLGFLPWGHGDDDPWFYVLTGLVCFTLLSIAAALSRSAAPAKPTQALNVPCPGCGRTRKVEE